MNRNKTARQHDFAIIPTPEIARSRFNMRQTRKMGFNASDLIPIMCEEVLPGDTWQHHESYAARLATPIAPIIDDMDFETFYFFVPNRIISPDWEDLITGADTNLTVPFIVGLDGAVTKIKAGSVFDHFGIMPQDLDIDPTVWGFTVYPIWGYFKIFNDWFRDQNLQQPYTWSATWGNTATWKYSTDITNGTAWDQMPLRVNKRHDYFTSSLPWAQKGNPVYLTLDNAPIVPDSAFATPTWQTGGAANLGLLDNTTGTGNAYFSAGAAQATGTAYWNNPHLEADMSSIQITINAMRLAAQTQKLLELDARGGSRYVEQLLVHWKVRSPDARLQRPEYLGGSRTPIKINPVAQTAAYDAEPDPATPSAIGNLGAEMHVSASSRTFTYAAVEHGYIIGLACVRSTPTYQQGTRKHWRRRGRLDFWFPVFDGLGEQAVDTQEIYQDTDDTPANATWGYQERAAEYRYTPNEITGPLRSTASLPLDWWHLSEKFTAEPALNTAFIKDKTQETLSRALAVDVATSEQWACQIVIDILHDSQVARLMPAYSVPGIKRF